MIKRKNKQAGKEIKSGKKDKQSTKSPPPVQWQENITFKRKSFPGPANAIVPLRVAMDREAFVEITEHVTKSMELEVCGVMVGEVCEDEEGYFVHVQHIIKGTATEQGGAHVTFTHETWDQIHSQLEKDYPKCNILGWYHSHPGFGVSFSEMDLFIQQNFFPSPTQFSLVMDPLGGEKALCVNTPQGIQYISKFWVDSREYRAFQPRNTGTDHEGNTGENHLEALAMVETRLNQVLHSMDKLSLSINRALTSMVAIFGILIMGIIFYTLYLKPAINSQPPKLLQYVPVPVKIAGKEGLVGVGIVDWEIPPEAAAYYNPYGSQPDSRDSALDTWLRSVIDEITSHFRFESYRNGDKGGAGPPIPDEKATQSNLNRFNPN